MSLIYMHYNTISRKSYIGLTTKSMMERWSQHLYTALATDDDGEYKSQVKFHRAIRKYGIDTWLHSVLHEATDDESLQELEVYYITKYDTYRKGYNSTLGGDGAYGVSGELVRRGIIANRKESVKGYYWDKRSQSYFAAIMYLGKMLNFGTFKLESEAKAKADYLFSLSDEELVVAYEEYKAGRSSRTKGYGWDKTRSKYLVALTVNGKSKNFGRYKSEQEAIERVAQLRNEF